MSKLKTKRQQMAESRKDQDWKPWDLWTSGVSSSFVNEYLHCRVQCRLRYIEGWKLRATGWTQFGEAFHEVMERVYTSCEAPPGPKRVRRYVRDWAQDERPKVKAGQPTVSFEQNMALVDVVAQAYFGHYGRSDFIKTEWVEQELKFRYPYVYPDGEETALTGVIDGIYKRGGRLYVMDTKSKSQINVEEIVDGFPMNFQFNLYLWVVWKMFKEMPAGAIMNVVRRPGEKILKKDGGLHGYLARVAEKIEKDPGHYLMRIPYPVEQDDLERWEQRQLHPIMKEIRMWYEGKLPEYANPHGLKWGMRRSDYFNAVCRDDYSDLENKGKVSRRKIALPTDGKWQKTLKKLKRKL